MKICDHGQAVHVCRSCTKGTNQCDFGACARLSRVEVLHRSRDGRLLERRPSCLFHIIAMLINFRRVTNMERRGQLYQPPASVIDPARSYRP